MADENKRDHIEMTLKRLDELQRLVGIWGFGITITVLVSHFWK